MIETEIAARLRRAAQALRTTSMPLADLIPLLQAAADEADRFHDGMVAWKKTADTNDAQIAAQITAPVAPVPPKCQFCQDSGEMLMGDCKTMPCDQCQPAPVGGNPDDAARLDWLEQSSRSFCGNYSGSGFRMIGSSIWHGTLREAIDGAMAEAKETP